MYRDVLRLLNGVLSFVEALLLIGCLLYAGYALWDNQQIYTSVSSLQNELLAFKPAEDADAAGPSFEELQAINPEVCAWLTMDGTRIDYPILRADNNSYSSATTSTAISPWQAACSWTPAMPSASATPTT